MVKETTIASEITDFLELFPEGKLSGVAKFKLKQLRRRFNPKVDRIKPESFSQRSTSTSAFTIIGKDGATEAYDKAIELRPDDAGFYNTLGKAIEAYQRAIELKPDYVINNLGLVYDEQGELDQAIEAYEDVVEVIGEEEGEEEVRQILAAYLA